MDNKPSAKPREIKQLFTQAPVTFPGVFTSETNLVADKVPGLEMVQSDVGVVIRKGNLYAMVPLMNIKIMVYK